MPPVGDTRNLNRKSTIYLKECIGWLKTKITYTNQEEKQKLFNIERDKAIDSDLSGTVTYINHPWLAHKKPFNLIFTGFLIYSKQMKMLKRVKIQRSYKGVYSNSWQALPYSLITYKINSDKDLALKGILTQAQYTTYENNKEAMKEKMKVKTREKKTQS